MLIELDPIQVETILEALNHSRLWISESEEMSFDRMQEKLRKIDGVHKKLNSALEGDDEK